MPTKKRKTATRRARKKANALRAAKVTPVAELPLYMRPGIHDPEVDEPLPEDCVVCGRCCFSNAWSFVRIPPRELARMGERSRAYVRYEGDGAYMRMEGGRCSALQVDEELGHFTCAVYEERPEECRMFARLSQRCLEVRALRLEHPTIQLIEIRRRAREAGTTD